MGRHSIQRKRVKRRNQKSSKRGRLRPVIENTVADLKSENLLGYTSHSAIINDEQSQTLNPSDATVLVSKTIPEDLYLTQLTPGESNAIDESTSDSVLFSALDRVGEDSDSYWNKLAEDKIQEFDSYHDAHPCIVTAIYKGLCKWQWSMQRYSWA